MKPILKCERRSDQRPTTPSCDVLFTGSMPRIGWRSSVAAGAPK
ncbi:hypothetical protein W824_00300 [Clavibacter cf. michiganensis LMG 26808]|nr:hypothetical protein W824_00300 [Clavibacter cf. michiganensis LMG 26808]